MESKNASIYLFIIASFLALVASVIDNEWLMILSKPIIIPALLIYYFVSEKKSTSLELLFILLVYFISDAITLVKLESAINYIMILDFVPYVLLIKVVFQDAIKNGFCKINFALGVFYFVVLMIAMFFLVDAFVIKQSDFLFPFISYGVILGLYVSISSYNYFRTDFSEVASFIFVAAIFGLIADVIFVFTNMVFNVKALTYIEFALQIISYFYIVTYFIDREKMHLSTKII